MTLQEWQAEITAAVNLYKLSNKSYTVWEAAMNILAKMVEVVPLIKHSDAEEWCQALSGEDNLPDNFDWTPQSSSNPTGLPPSIDKLEPIAKRWAAEAEEQEKEARRRKREAKTHLHIGKRSF